MRGAKSMEEQKKTMAVESALVGLHQAEQEMWIQWSYFLEYFRELVAENKRLKSKVDELEIELRIMDRGDRDD